MSYSDQVLDHFHRPQNYGQIENPDGVGEVGNLTCGDVMKLYIKVEPNQEKEDIISEIKFETFGCVAAIATSSMITNLALGKTLEQALEIKNEHIVDSLEGLPVQKIHCSVLAADALVEAIYDYLSSNNKKISKELEKKHRRIARHQAKFAEI